MNPDDSATHANLRTTMLAKRDAMPREEIELRSRIILVKAEVLKCVSGASLILCYLPAGSEVNTAEFLANLLSRGHGVALPVRAESGLLLSELKTLAGLTTGPDGRPRPAEVLPIKPSECDAAIVPGVAFGQDGTRLGYGLGDYARLLESLTCPRIAPVYDFQVSSQLAGKPSVDLILGDTLSYGNLE